jgi:hypothetical protein
MLSVVIYVYSCLTRFIYHMMFVSTTATYKTSNTVLPLQSTRVHIFAQPCHTSSHHRSGVLHEFTSPLSRVRVNQSLIVCVVFGPPLSFCHFCFGHDSCCPWNSIFWFPLCVLKTFFLYNSTPNSQLGMFDLQFTWYLYILSCLAILVDTI